jgi:hypothetical protein
VHHDITVIEKDPASGSVTLAPVWAPVAHLPHLVDDIVLKRIDLPLTIAAADYEIVRQERNCSQIQHDDVTRLPI